MAAYYRQQQGRGPAPAGADQRHAQTAAIIHRLNYVQKPVVTHQVAQLLRSQPNLQPSETHYMSNSGRDDVLLKLAGTVPTVHQGSTYHTPLSVMLPLGFPNEPPIVDVPPAAGMHVDDKHSMVTPSGRVRLYWERHLQLAPAIQDLCVRFGIEPPLHSGPKPPPVADITEQVTDKMKRLAATVYKGLHGQLVREVERGLTIQARSSLLQENIEALKAAKQSQIQHLAQLERMSAAAGGDGKAAEEELTLVAETAVEQQMFDLVGRVLAAEDTIFMLDKAVENETVTMADFVKAVRRLARDKFEARALVQKIFGLQQQAVASGAWATRNRK